MNETITIQTAIQKYLEMIETARSKNTYDTYRYAMQAFVNLLADNKMDAAQTPVSALREDAVGWFAAWLKGHAPATEQLYLQAAMGFYKFLAAEKLASPTLPRLEQLIRMRARKTGQRLPQFPREDIERVLTYVSASPAPLPSPGEGRQGEAEAEQLRWLRDRAFLLTLADTGLRVHEACKLRRGDIDWNEGRAILIGKGDKQDVVRFSSRSLRALKEYLSARAALDGASGRPLPSLPLFARHDKGAGKKVKPVTTATGRNIVEERVRQALGEDAVGRITPHSFRHYFVTTVLRASGNLKLAQALARHASIAVTQRYAHLSDDELDRGYHEIFERTSPTTAD
ncbi:MAG: tyrosine-type recombinase/integrase [Anaerolineales bacterium]|nr:tyrosine-type recombinase/integrase [Anaerolineales bacterium]